MTYKVSMLRRAQKVLAELPKGDYERVRDAVAALSENPRPSGCKRLVGRDGWRIRQGDYRVIYEVDDLNQQVLILDVGHRRDVYN